MGPEASALVAEGMRRSAVCWVRPGGSSRPYVGWHVWLDGAAYFVSGGREQSLPGIADARTAEVVVRAKDTRERLVTWAAEVETLSPWTPEWRTATAALLAARLNLPDPDTAVERWARECTVSRLTPTGEPLEPPSP